MNSFAELASLLRLHVYQLSFYMVILYLGRHALGLERVYLRIHCSLLDIVTLCTCIATFFTDVQLRRVEQRPGTPGALQQFDLLYLPESYREHLEAATVQGILKPFTQSTTNLMCHIRAEMPLVEMSGGSRQTHNILPNNARIGMTRSYPPLCIMKQTSEWSQLSQRFNVTSSARPITRVKPQIS